MFQPIPCKRLLSISLAALLYATSAISLARLPAPTPEQEKIAADKKANAADEAEAEKQRLAATMEKIAARWRARANENNWPAYQPTPVHSEKSGAASANEDMKKAAPAGTTQ